ncbi:hypothetical protein M5D96_006746 [Drosophila gunungcola]|uniref:Uncharacterized protein n=1 Tax=Drosophila gunungcola TaxID=103775 RepID=A0A9P9YPK8_9MUSC|nr:hypothetical protein M5D96_006746 [Drosophila gunungcola]
MICGASNCISLGWHTLKLPPSASSSSSSTMVIVNRKRAAPSPCGYECRQAKTNRRLEWRMQKEMGGYPEIHEGAS